MWSASGGFTPASRPYGDVLTYISNENYTAYLMGDINGDWNPLGATRPANPMDDPDAVQASLPVTFVQAGSTVDVPLSLDNLKGASVGSYQFDIEYDPTVVAPALIAADLDGTMSGALSVIYNAEIPGLLKVAVFGAIPASGDGVYVNLHFDAVGKPGLASPLTISAFVVNDGSETVAVNSGQVTITESNNTGLLQGRLLTAHGKPVSGGIVTITNSTRGRARSTHSGPNGEFEISSLVIGSTYTVRVSTDGYVFIPVIISITDPATGVVIIAEP